MFRELSREFRLLIARITGITPAVKGQAPNCLRFADSPLRVGGTPVPIFRFPRSAVDDHRSPVEMARPGHTSDPHPPELTPAVRQIATAWPMLPPHIQEAILTLVDAARLKGAGDDRQ